jgi:queuosine precursor transporter
VKSIEVKTSILLGLFVTALILANLLGNKVTIFIGVRASVGIFMFPLLFLITDIVEEVLGKEKAKMFVYVGLLSLVVTLFFLFLAINLPAHEIWGLQEAYESTLSQSMRIIIASLAAFFISQMHDLWAFQFWKNKTRGKYLWLRNNLSTITSQLIDTTIFMFLAFYLLTPKFTAWFVITLIIPYWLLKVFMAFIDTPFVYLGVKWLRRK